MTSGLHLVPPAVKASLRARARAHFVGRGGEREALASLLSASREELHVLLLRGEAGVGKTTLLRLFSWEAEEAGHRVVWVSGEHVAPTPASVTAELSHGLQSADPWAELGSRDKTDILVLDAAEHLWPCASWVFGEALPRAGRRVLVILASRTAMPAKLRAQLAFATSIAELGVAPFTKSELGSAMDARGIPRGLEEEVERDCAGSPLAFALVAEHFARTGKLPSVRTIDDPWVVLSQEFLRDATTAPQANALRALSMSRLVDADLLGAMLEVEDALSLYRFLAELSFVDATPAGLVLHGVVRRSIFAELKNDRPELLLQYVERAVDVLSIRAATAPLGASSAAFLDAFYVARHSRAGSSLFLEDLSRHALRRARDEDIAWIRGDVERFEGKASRETFDALVPLQRDSLFVIDDENGEPESVFFCVDAAAAPAEVLAKDATLRLAIEHSRTKRPRVARFWFVRDTYQDFGFKMTALMCAGPPITLVHAPFSELFFAVEDPERWRPLAAVFGMRHIDDVLIPFPGHGGQDGHVKGIAIVDLDMLTDPGMPWRERHVQIFRVLARNVAELSARAPAILLEHDAFVDAVREALPLLHRHLELAESPLLDAAVVRKIAAAEQLDPVGALVPAFERALTTLAESPAYANEADVLRATYFGRPDKHESIAANLQIPFGTFRHRLRRATARLAEALWRLETSARS